LTNINLLILHICREINETFFIAHNDITFEFLLNISEEYN